MDEVCTNRSCLDKDLDLWLLPFCTAGVVWSSSDGTELLGKLGNEGLGSGVVLKGRVHSPPPTIPAHFSTLSQRVPDIFHKSLCVLNPIHSDWLRVWLRYEKLPPRREFVGLGLEVGFGDCRQTLAVPGCQASVTDRVGIPLQKIPCSNCYFLPSPSSLFPRRIPTASSQSQLNSTPARLFILGPKQNCISAISLIASK